MNYTNGRKPFELFNVPLAAMNATAETPLRPARYSQNQSSWSFQSVQTVEAGMNCKSAMQHPARSAPNAINVRLIGAMRNRILPLGSVEIEYRIVKSAFELPLWQL